MLAIVPLFLIALIYVIASAERHAENPNDKLLPTVAAMVARDAAACRSSRTADRRIRAVGRHRGQPAAAGAGARRCPP